MPREQHLVVGVQAVGAPGKLSPVRTKLPCLQPPVLGQGVEAVKLSVGGIADHHAPPLADVPSGAVPVVDHAPPRLLTGAGDV